MARRFSLALALVSFLVIPAQAVVIQNAAHNASVRDATAVFPPIQRPCGQSRRKRASEWMITRSPSTLASMERPFYSNGCGRSEERNTCLLYTSDAADDYFWV